jgi:hypothetical protein
MVNSIIGFDSSVLLSYYNAQLANSAVSANISASASSTTASSSKSATAADSPPWENLKPPGQQAQDAKVLGITKFIDTSNVPYSAGSTSDTKTEQDNQKLFSLYTAINNLAYLAKMSQRSGATAGQMEGYNTRFQEGLAQVKDYLASTSFNNFTLQTGKTQSSVTSGVSLAYAPFTYQGSTIVPDANIADAVPGVSASDSFTIAVKKGGVTTNVAIDLSQISGPLSIDNIVNYANQQLSAAGFNSKLQRVMTDGSIDDPTKSSYGIAITQAPSEALTFSSAAATPALYLAGNSGTTAASTTTTAKATTDTPADQQGRLIKLTDLASGTPAASFNATLNPDTGNTTTAATAVDSNGNVYTIGTATGNFGDELNQGTQDVVLTKYDSAGNLQWSKLLGSAGTADAYSLAIDSGNNVVVAGSTTANLSPTGISDGSADSFVAKYDADGNQSWVKQIPTLATNSASTVSVDASGNIYVGGQVSGVIGKGQTNYGKQDGYIAQLDSKGNISYEQQIGTSGTDSVAATAIDASGNLFVASVENGEAILTKYAGGDATTAPVWQQDLGALGNGGSIGGLAVSNGKVYLSGTSANGNLTSGGAASVIGATSGGLDAFVAGFTDSGASVSADTVTYIGTSATEKAGAVTVDASGNVYLAGTTSGTFAGQTRNVQNTQNAFVTALDASGNVSWTKQYGGASGTSTGAGIAIDTTGSSVLDALGLPRGKIDINQSVDLTSATTLRPGNSFQLKIDTASSSYTATITIDEGETLKSLADKINNALLTKGKASTTYSSGGNALKIAVNAGVSATLIAGPADLDALGRLGLTPETISNGATTTASSGSSSSSSKQVFGLGFSGLPLDISTSTDAGAARAELLNVLSSITGAYRTSNTPASSTSTTQAGDNTPMSQTQAQYFAAQNADSNLALSMLSSYQASQQQNALLGVG